MADEYQLEFPFMKEIRMQETEKEDRIREALWLQYHPVSVSPISESSFRINLDKIYDHYKKEGLFKNKY